MKLLFPVRCHMAVEVAKVDDPSVGNLGRNLKAAREEREWTQEDLAHHAGIQPAEISRIETGKRDLRLSTIERLAKALNIPPGRLLD